MLLLPSQRSGLYIFERARIYQRHGRVEYTCDEGREPRSFALPHANAVFVIIGPGSSITTEAVRQLKSEGVCLGFSGSGGAPLLMADEPYFMSPADEYRNPSYLQRWIGFWPDADKRLAAAKVLMRHRIAVVESCWADTTFDAPWPTTPTKALDAFYKAIDRASAIQNLLGDEGAFTKALYKAAATSANMTGFSREPRSSTSITDANTTLDHGNYLAYGLAHVVLWTLGLSPSLPLTHGNTRRGALVFDIADVIKDGIILPLAFNFAARASADGLTETDFRSACIDAFDRHKALTLMFDAVEAAITEAA